MHSLSYQSGSLGVELLSPSGGTDKRASTSLGSNVQRAYDRGIKGYLFNITGTSRPGSGGIQCPASSSLPKDTLGIVQPLLVLQIQTFPGQSVALELVVTDAQAQRRRLFFSSAFRQAECNQLHVQLPWSWSNVQPGAWYNLAINLQDLTARFFRGAEFASLDSFCVRPACQIRKIFSLPLSLLRVSGPATDLNLSLEIPRVFDFPIGVASSQAFYVCLTSTGETVSPSRNPSHGRLDMEITGKPILCSRSGITNNAARKAISTRTPTKTVLTSDIANGLSPMSVSLAAQGQDLVPSTAALDLTLDETTTTERPHSPILVALPTPPLSRSVVLEDRSVCKEGRGFDSRLSHAFSESLEPLTQPPQPPQLDVLDRQSAHRQEWFHRQTHKILCDETENNGAVEVDGEESFRLQDEDDRTSRSIAVVSSLAKPLVLGYSRHSFDAPSHCDPQWPHVPTTDSFTASGSSSEFPITLIAQEARSRIDALISRLKTAKHCLQAAELDFHDEFERSD